MQLAAGTDPTFVNDVVVTRDAAYFTDSRRPALYRLPLANDGAPGPVATVVTVAGGGYTHVPPPANNLNGIDATPDGKTLVVVQTVTGKLFRIDAATAETTEIGLGGATLENGDGILLHGRTLYVVQNRSNQIAVVSLAAGPRLGDRDRHDHGRRLRRADHHRQVREPPVRREREVQHRADAGHARTRSSRSTADPRAGRPADGRAPRRPRAGRLAAWSSRRTSS